MPMWRRVLLTTALAVFVLFVVGCGASTVQAAMIRHKHGRRAAVCARVAHALDLLDNRQRPRAAQKEAAAALADIQRLQGKGDFACHDVLQGRFSSVQALHQACVQRAAGQQQQQQQQQPLV